MYSETDENEETPEGFHIEGEEDEDEEKLPSLDADKELDIDADEPSDEDLGQLEEVSAPSQPSQVAHLAVAQVDGVRQTNTGKPLLTGHRYKMLLM
jgi:copper chaperone CopZ